MKNYQTDILKAIDNCQTELDYIPHDFLKMIDNLGFVGASKQLLSNEQYIQSGIMRLWKERKLEWSVEAIVVKPEHKHLFTYTEVMTAHKRLKDLGYSPKI